MNFEQFTVYINSCIRTRFTVLDQDALVVEIESLASDNIAHKQVLRFFRHQNSGEFAPSCKTLLIIAIDKQEYIREGLEWVALSKDLLLDPETADIYLFILWSGENKPSTEECLRIEGSEDFCRKFVLRPDEDEQSFVERTFITKLNTPDAVDLGQDPLLAAFAGLEEKFSWFDEAEKNRWRQAFNSGLSSYDLFNALIDDKSGNNEAS